MSQVQQLLTEHLNIWTAAETEKKSGRGRASGSAGKVYGIQKLRSLILDLAVCGRLVQPIGDSKTESIKHIKLGQLVDVLDSLRKPVTKQDRTQGAYPYYGASGIVDFVSNYIFDEPLVLVGEDGAKWGKAENTAFMIEGKTWVNNHAHVIRPKRDLVIDKYLTYCLNAMDLSEFITGITVPKLNQAKLVSIDIPLPSTEQQYRIVAKVDELMALCDQLEQQHSNAAEAHEKLVEHLLGTLTQAQNAQDFNSQWQRIYAHFDTLFTTEASIDTLKQTLLQLAVMGKLVPQDANDEPASELLKRIQAEKAELVAEGKLKKENPLAPITDDEKPFELPKVWEWVRFAEIAQHNSGKTLDKGRNKGLPRDYITTSNLYWGEFELASVRQMPIEESELERCTAIKGDLLICEGGEAGRAAVWNMDKEVCFQNHIHRARLYGEINPFYAYRYFEKLNATGEIEFYRKGVGISNMSGKALASIIFALPPLDEQHRIVAKVDELMALCDQLKTRIQQASQKQQLIADALVGQATA